MKQRTTYLVSSAEATHPDNFVIEPTRLQIKSLHGAREDRFTIGYDELPTGIRDVLRQCSEIVVRWATGKIYAAVDPFGSRVPAGLHIYASPSREVVPSVCRLVNTVFGIDGCKSFRESFTEIPGGYQFYSPLPSIAALPSYLAGLLCTGRPSSEDCKARVASIESADYVDIKYDAVSQTLAANVFWSRPQEPWQETVRPTEGHGNIEVGVLGNEKPMDDESLTLAGVLHVVGKDDKLEPVLFTFASRHLQVPASYKLAVLQPTGLHPNLRLSISQPLRAPAQECTLNAYFTLPRELFVDKYQLSSTNHQLLESLNIKQLRGISGETDLEAPVWASSRWGSTVLMEVDHVAPAAQGKDWLEVQLPLHLRYLEPKNASSFSEFRFSHPTVFWACQSELWSKMANSPFDRLRLGWEHWFPEQTMYYHLSPADDAWKAIEVPVLDLQHATVIKVGTFVVIFGGFLWVCWKLLAAVFLGGRGGGGREERVKKMQ